MNLPISAASLLDDQNEPVIQPNSQYDQSISFSDSSSGDAAITANPAIQAADSNGAAFNEVSGLGFQLQGNNSNDDFGGGFSPRPGFNNDNGFNFGSGKISAGNNNDFTFNSDRFGGIGSNTSPELAPVFALISQFQPPPLEITPHFKPFLPELVASIGAIDAFIKVPRPDNEQEQLGLTVLDEPTIGCANPQILKMQLREKFNVVTNDGDSYIGKIESSGDTTKALQNFIDSYDEIQRNRAAPTMTYSYKMPDLEELMEVWPEEMEKAFDSLPLPSADMDLTVDEYAKVICAMLEIPVKGNLVESLHVMFSLYNEFKQNQYFNAASTTSTPMKDKR